MVSWYTMCVPWHTMLHHSLLWYTTVRLWCVMTLSYHDIISWYDSVITHHSRTVVLLVYHNKLWWSMVYHGIPVYRGIPYIPWYTSIPWYTMVYHGMVPRYTMIRPCGDTSRLYYGVPWYTMVYYSIPWYTMVHHGTPRHDCDVLWHCRTMIYHGVHHAPWYTMDYYGVPWCTMVYVRMWLVMTRSQHGTPWYVIVCHGITCFTLV